MQLPTELVTNSQAHKDFGNEFSKKMNLCTGYAKEEHKRAVQFALGYPSVILFQLIERMKYL